MKIAPAKQENFVKNPDKHYQGFLFYGPDEGRTRHLSLQLIRHFLGSPYDLLNLAEITGDSLSEDPAKLSDELSSFSLMGGDRAVLLRQATNDSAKVIEGALMSEPGPVWPLIVTAGDLRPSSKLRKLFEANKQTAAIACYHDDSRKVTQILAEEMRSRGITCEQGVIPLLAKTLGNDHAVTLQEIDKIDLYLGEKRHVTLATIETLSGDNRDHTLDELFHAICAGHGDLEATLTRCFNEALPPIAIYRMLSSHLQKLISIKTMIGAGMASKAAFTRHGVFFKQEPLIQQQIRYWNEPALRRAITAILEAEQQTKAGIVPAEMVCRNLLHKLSRHASRGKRAA